MKTVVGTPKKSKFELVKKSYVFLALTLISWKAQSQKSFFGLDAGINVANQREHYSFNPVTYYSSGYSIFNQNTVKPTFGFFYQKEFAKGLGIRLQARYMGMGYNKRQSNNNLSINYLTFPISLNYSVTKHLAFFVGSYVSFTLNGTKVNNQVITKAYHKNDFGFSFGAEHDLYKNFAIGTTYYLGTKNIWLNDQGGSIKYTNRTLQFALIYKFKKLQ